MKILKNILVFAFIFFAFSSFSNFASAQVQNSLYLSQNNVNVILGQSTNISINNNTYGTFYVSSNSNQNSVNVSISGNLISFYGNSIGNSTVTICQNNSNNCSTVYVTVSNNTWNNNSNILISNISLPLGSSMTLGSSNNSGIYVSSNSNSSVVNTSNNTAIDVGCVGYNSYNIYTGQPCYSNLSYYNNSYLTINALSVGSSTLTICQSNSICNTFNVNVVKPGSVLGISTNNNSCFINRTLRFGMSGSDVLCLQNYLIGKGYYINNSNSYFDYDTRNAVILFQRDNGLFPDGVVGRNTRNYLY